MDATFGLTAVPGAVTAESLPVTGKEEKELRRVFEKLCDYQARTRCKDNIGQLEMGIKLMRNQNQGEHTSVTLELQEKVNGFKKELAELDAKTEHLVSCDDVYEMLKTLKHLTDKKLVEEMIWEVDEDLDGKLCWPEFRLMYNRNIMDRTGLEPSKMYNLVQFMIYDRNENNRVSVDETMNMLYARYGKSRMEEKLKELFGGNMQETGREGGDISFGEFMQAVEGVQLRTFWKTQKGKNIASTALGRRSMELTKSL